MHDKFHIAKHLGEAVDRVRRAENKTLQAEDDDRLKGPRQLWLLNKADLSPAQRRRFAAIRQNGLKTARAWAIKKEFSWFWRHVYSTSAEKLFSQWNAWARALPPPARHQGRQDAQASLPPNLLSYFSHRTTNATSEGFNSVIQALKYAARGFRSFRNYRTRILFLCGKLDLRQRLPCH